MKKFLKYFTVALVIFTVALLPLQVFLSKMENVRPFSGKEDLMKDMVPIAVDKSSPLYEAFRDKDRVNVLLLGVNDGMTDTIMLGSYDMKNQHVAVISIPRDTFYDRPGAKSTAAKKINAIFHGKPENGGGAVGTARAVSDVLQGMPIHYYVVVKYEGVKNIVDTIGGVRMEIPFHMKYEDPTDKPPLYIDIPAGEQIIDSKNVVQFLRFRHTNPFYARKGFKSYPGGGDIDRIKMQQEFMKQALKQSLNLKLPKIVGSILDNVDSDLKLGVATKIAAKASGVSMDAIETYTLPGAARTIDRLSFWKQDKEATKEMLMQIYSIGDKTEEEKAEEEKAAAEARKPKGLVAKLWQSVFGGSNDGEGGDFAEASSDRGDE